MNMFHTMIASLTFVVMCFEAGAAESPKTGGASTVVADLGSAAGNAAPNRDASSKADRVSGSESPRAGASMGVAPRGRHPAAAVARLRSSLTQPRGVGKAPRIRTDPQRVLLNPKARGPLAPRSVGSTDTGPGGTGIRTPFGVKSVGQRPLAASTRAILPAMKVTATSRDSIIGGPRGQALGRIGGPLSGQASHSATIDGTQLHHKF
jgi:hypothetical protein